MAKMIRTTEPTLQVIRDTSAPLAHVAPVTVEAALGAEPSAQKLEEVLAPITLFAIRSERLAWAQQTFDAQEFLEPAANRWSH